MNVLAALFLNTRLYFFRQIVFIIRNDDVTYLHPVTQPIYHINYGQGIGNGILRGTNSIFCGPVETISGAAHGLGLGGLLVERTKSLAGNNLASCKNVHEKTTKLNKLDTS